MRAAPGRARQGKGLVLAQVTVKVSRAVPYRKQGRSGAICSQNRLLTEKGNGATPTPRVTSPIAFMASGQFYGRYFALEGGVSCFAGGHWAVKQEQCPSALPSCFPPEPPYLHHHIPTHKLIPLKPLPYTLLYVI
ncbi:hypothetical protein FIBSPDRAFT_892987 [Athelia psychrophila]|uniref:Uncharacterized protein n=1 Tax=Athelia psychrophila TaxID=1759441 RepID=A0A166HT65_9AGAM|nr:hypothetical protein FIBSPDRAFT_892987 [Fibularhizoctonia sp. CBS 109695]